MEQTFRETTGGLRRSARLLASGLLWFVPLICEIALLKRPEGISTEVEKSIKKQISRFAFGSFEMTINSVFYKAL
ncbi:MAG: hypothetical protein DRP62_06765 [Planctomycetota bacterium]|nr:MAG: hypothetical protein DRP62_06765 [Planctomycetota bacterium]